MQTGRLAPTHGIYHPGQLRRQESGDASSWLGSHFPGKHFANGSLPTCHHSSGQSDPLWKAEQLYLESPTNVDATGVSVRVGLSGCSWKVWWGPLLGRPLKTWTSSLPWQRTASGHPSSKPRIILSNPETPDNLPGQVLVIVGLLAIGITLNLCQGHLVSYQLLSGDSCRMPNYSIPKEGDLTMSVHRGKGMK